MYNSRTLFVRRLPISREMDDKGSQGTDLNIFPMKNVNNQTRRPLNAKEKKAPDNSNKKEKKEIQKARESK